jgi:hypothetical protein
MVSASTPPICTPGCSRIIEPDGCIESSLSSAISDKFVIRFEDTSDTDTAFSNWLSACGAKSLDELTPMMDRVNNGELSDYTEIELPATSHRVVRQDIWSLYLPELSGRIFNELIFLMHESAKGSRDKNIYIASSGCLTEG